LTCVNGVIPKREALSAGNSAETDYGDVADGSSARHSARQSKFLKNSKHPIDNLEY
jgi:hypothetical protein